MWWGICALWAVWKWRSAGRGRWEEGRRVCEGKQILKFNIIVRKQVKNGRDFKGYVVFRQREICFTCNVTLFERSKCVYRVPKQIGCVRDSQELNLFLLRVTMTFVSLAEHWTPLLEFWTYKFRGCRNCKVIFMGKGQSYLHTFLFYQARYSPLLFSSHKVDIYDIYYTCIEKIILCLLIKLQLFTWKYILRDFLKNKFSKA
jgi:hypothetical protein